MKIHTSTILLLGIKNSLLGIKNSLLKTKNFLLKKENVLNTIQSCLCKARAALGTRPRFRFCPTGTVFASGGTSILRSRISAPIEC